MNEQRVKQLIANLLERASEKQLRTIFLVVNEIVKGTVKE